MESVRQSKVYFKRHRQHRLKTLRVCRTNSLIERIFSFHCKNAEIRQSSPFKELFFTFLFGLRNFRRRRFLFAPQKRADKNTDSGQNHEETQNLPRGKIQKRSVHVYWSGRILCNPVSYVGIGFSEIFDEKTEKSIAGKVNPSHHSVPFFMLPECEQNQPQNYSLKKRLIKLTRMPWKIHHG